MKTIHRLWPHVWILCLASAFLGVVLGTVVASSVGWLNWIAALSGWFGGGMALLAARVAFGAVQRQVKQQNLIHEYQYLQKQIDVLEVECGSLNMMIEAYEQMAEMESRIGLAKAGDISVEDLKGAINTLSVNVFETVYMAQSVSIEVRKTARGEADAIKDRILRMPDFFRFKEGLGLYLGMMDARMKIIHEWKSIADERRIDVLQELETISCKLRVLNT